MTRDKVKRFRTEGNLYYEKLLSILMRNERQIVKECQEYLNRYEGEGRPPYAVDLDRAINLMESR